MAMGEESMENQEGCVFCGLIAQAKALLDENEHFVAFEPKEIEAPGHMLIVSKQHVEGLEALDLASGASLLDMVRRLSAASRKEGFMSFNLLNASGKAAQQSVGHAHLHFIPRKDGDGLNAWPDFEAGAQG